MLRMNELTQSEREFLDKVQLRSKKYNNDESKSLWNVCNAYLSGKIKDNFLSLPDDEIESVLMEINDFKIHVDLAKNKDVTTVRKVKSKKPSSALF